jgi:hypothetical protein
MTMLALAVALQGCAHRIAFHELAYSIPARRHDAAIVCVIDERTLGQVVSIHSFVTGAAHSWDAEPGMMLKQVADVELPQICSSYEAVTDYRDAPAGRRGLALVLEVPGYDFRDFHSIVTVHAIAYGAGRSTLFDRSYTEEGDSQGGKMFWGGAFAMKSAVRQSSLDAYRKIFARLRADLDPLLDGGDHAVTP